MVVLFTAVSYCNTQVKLDEHDLTNLISISELYSQNPNAAGGDFAKTADSLRTPALNHIVDTLITVGRGDRSIIESRFLSRPGDDELMMWYVMREIHYNRTSETKTNRTSAEVARAVLSKKIDSRWLLDNYYYRIHGGIALLFNTTDLSKDNFDLETLGFKNPTEKAIFFLNMIDALVGGRFRVLSAMKNHQKILEFANRLPKFNGKEYYRYNDFDYDDFDWIGYQKTESYNHRHMGMFFSVLLTHANAVTELINKKVGQEIFFDSILHEPRYFKFSDAPEQLQKISDSFKAT